MIVSDDNLYPINTSGNPKHSIAFKMVLDDQIAESIVTDVIWTPSKDGYLKPTVIVDPVEIGGTIIERATAHNAKFIIENKIGPNTVIKLVRSGDVIPYIQKIVKSTVNKYLPQCHFLSLPMYLPDCASKISQVVTAG